jgi:hypothetical protein
MGGPKDHAPAIPPVGSIRNPLTVTAKVIALTPFAAAAALNGQMNFVDQHRTPLKEKRPKSLGSLFGLFELG